ncbi:MAG: hypothetical protein ACXWV9_01245 [Flavisolibacter sp.]
MNALKYIRKNIYRWHRITSIVVALPVFLWTLSGFLHPVMGSFKPDVRNQSLTVIKIDTNKISINLNDALKKNNISKLQNFRIVQLDSKYYYQIQQLKNDTLTYLSCNDGNILSNGDRIYAAYLAKRYLSKPGKKQKENTGHHHGLAADIGHLSVLSTPIFATSEVKDIELITEFSSDYKSSYVLLPVYKVSFHRSDNISLYIETSTDRLSTAIDNKKAWFNKFFAATHSWSFLNEMGDLKQILLGSLSILCLLTSLFGFYVYNITNKKKKTTIPKSRSSHRVLGNIFVLTTLLYAFSGAWHAFYKISDKTERTNYTDRSEFQKEELNFSFQQITKMLKSNENLINVSIVEMDNKKYWQVFFYDGKRQSKKYLNSTSFQELQNGDIEYGCYLACLFSGKTHQSIKSSECLTEFNHQYSMMKKRLPVIEVSFDNDENYYVETATGKLSAIINPSDRAERFNFSNLHMHHYWEMWLGKGMGKPAKNFLLITSSLGLLLLAMTGIVIYLNKRRKKSSRTTNVSS